VSEEENTRSYPLHAAGSEPEVRSCKGAPYAQRSRCCCASQQTT